MKGNLVLQYGSNCLQAWHIKGDTIPRSDALMATISIPIYDVSRALNVPSIMKDDYDFYSSLLDDGAQCLIYYTRPPSERHVSQVYH